MKTNLRLLLASVCALGTIVSAAPLDVTDQIITTVENLGGNTRRITQTLDVTSPVDPETEDDGLTFTIDRSGSAAGGIYSGTLTQVNVTIRYSVDDIQLTVTNDSPTETFEGGSEDQATSVNTWQTFSFGADTGNFPTPLTNIQSTQYAGTMLTLDLNGVDIAPLATASEGPFDYTHTETRDVDTSFFSQYSGAGTFGNTFDTLFSTSNSVVGSNVSSSQTVGAVSFFVEVEYIVIPEPGTMALAGLAFASAGGIFLIRRKRR